MALVALFLGLVALTLLATVANDEATAQTGPTISIDKGANPLSLPAPGGDFTFSVTVANTSTVPLLIVSLNDNIYGNIGDPARPNNTCDDLIGDVLASGEDSFCTFVGAFTGDAGDSQTDVVTVVGSDDAGNQVTNSDDAMVTLSGTISVPSTTVPTTTTTTRPLTCTKTGAGNIVGTAGPDVICGSSGPDNITGSGGNDTIFGNGGNDNITGGDGNDKIFGGPGNDTMTGGNGNDTISGQGGVDKATGGSGTDSCSAETVLSCP